MTIEYICDKCGRSFIDTPGYLSYGLKKGEPFLIKLCKNCNQDRDNSPDVKVTIED